MAAAVQLVRYDNKGKKKEETAGLSTTTMPALLKLAALACVITLGQGFITVDPSAKLTTSRGQCGQAKKTDPSTSSRTVPRMTRSRIGNTHMMALREDDNNVKVRRRVTRIHLQRPGYLQPIPLSLPFTDPKGEINRSRCIYIDRSWLRFDCVQLPGTREVSAVSLH